MPSLEVLRRGSDKMRIGVYLPNWIGDVVMATPTLRSLREHFGESAEIVGIMRPYVAEVLQGTLWLNDTILFDRRSKNPELRHGAWCLAFDAADSTNY